MKKNHNIIFDLNIKGEKVSILKKDKERYIISKEEAIDLAHESLMNLIQLSFDKKLDMAICIIENINKYKFTIDKQKKNQSISKIKIKEVLIRTKTDINDFTEKVNRIITFLKKKNNVKINIRGDRKNPNNKEIIENLFKQLEEQLSTYTSSLTLISKNSFIYKVDAIHIK